jgi:hypothetical protein
MIVIKGKSRQICKGKVHLIMYTERENLHFPVFQQLFVVSSKAVSLYFIVAGKTFKKIMISG